MSLSMEYPAYNTEGPLTVACVLYHPQRFLVRLLDWILGSTIRYVVQLLLYFASRTLALQNVNIESNENEPRGVSLDM